MHAYRFITGLLFKNVSCVDDTDFEELGRRKIFYALSVSIIILLVSFGTDYLFTQTYLMGSIIYATAIVFMAFMAVHSRLRDGKPVYRISTLALMVLLLYWTYTGTTEGQGSIWILGFSPFVLFLLGKREGTLWIIVIGFLSAIIFFNPFSLPGVYAYPPEYSIRHLILYTVIFFFIYYYEVIRIRYKNAMLAEHDELQIEKELLSQAKKQLEHANKLLNEEIRIRERTEQSLVEHKNNLERMVTERTLELREKNIQLKSSEQRYRLITDNIDDVIWMIDTGLNFTYISPSIQRMLGYSVEEMMQLPLQNLFTTDSFNHLMKVYEKNLEFIKNYDNSTDRYLSVTCDHVKKDGALLKVEITLSLIVDTDHEVVGIGGVTRDISERVKAQQEKEKIQNQLAQSQKMEAIGTLAGGVAHDFNNMLSAIIGYAELALREVNPEDRLHKNLERIYDAANRSADLTRQLLAFARKQTVSPRFLDMNDSVQSILKMIRRLIGENIELVWLPGICSGRVCMDPSQIDQILVNLCVNARDAITGVGKITICTGTAFFDKSPAGSSHDLAPGRYVLLSVEDSGQGMDKQTLEHIFEPFFTTKGLGRGTGMGLATVYGIVKQNKGAIEVCSEELHGTIFKIYLPCHEVEAEEVQREDMSNISTGKGETILIIEDDPVLLEMGKEMLQLLGYTVITAASPGEAIRIVLQTPMQIDLFITDVIMPEMNGRQLAERLHVIRPKMKYLFTSGYTSNVIANKGVLGDGLNFIPKPYSLRSFAIKLRDILDH